jgi:UDP-2-acetamido-3-amino-2,3-dideoxy-glucuronate N-acetyltransferase
VTYFAHPTAVIDHPCEIGEGTRIWHFAHICAGARIGCNSIFGQNTMVAAGVVIGSNVKVQNNVAIYTGTTVEDDVFLGPSCVLTNVTNPRSQVRRHNLYESTLIRRGATIGANATVACGTVIGRYAFIGAGALVGADVPDYGLILGLPGRLEGWMSRHGHRLHFGADSIAVCRESSFRYQLTNNHVRCLDLDEEEPLPDGMREGHLTYDELKSLSPEVPPRTTA